MLVGVGTFWFLANIIQIRLVLLYEVVGQNWFMVVRFNMGPIDWTDRTMKSYRTMAWVMRFRMVPSISIVWLKSNDILSVFIVCVIWVAIFWSHWEHCWGPWADFWGSMGGLWGPWMDFFLL